MCRFCNEKTSLTYTTDLFFRGKIVIFSREFFFCLEKKVTFTYYSRAEAEISTKLFSVKDRHGMSPIPKRLLLLCSVRQDGADDVR